MSLADLVYIFELFINPMLALDGQVVLSVLGVVFLLIVLWAISGLLPLGGDWDV